MNSNPSSSSQNPQFLTTQWSLVIAAADQRPEDDSAVHAEALQSLCQKYWFPLYAFVRSLGHQSNDAQDLIQAFFERLIEKRFIIAADPNRGRFRTFLLASLKNFLINEWKKNTREKRGRGKSQLSIGFDNAEDRLKLDPATVQTPEKLFEQQWALSILDNVLQRLRDAYRAAGNERILEALEPYLMADSQQVPYQETADKFGMTAGSVKVNVHRLRARYREFLEQEIADTVDSSEAIEDEIRCLFSAFSR